jgi:phage FluMu gp28-like protein
MAVPLLLPYQQAWLASTALVRVWEKSRRIGASWACACESVLDAATEGSQGCNVYYTCYKLDITRQFIADCTMWAKALLKFAVTVETHEDKDPNGVRFQVYSIRFPSGHHITAVSSKPSNLRGVDGRIIIDEAAFLNDLAETLKAATPNRVWGQRIDILSTHNGVGNEFNRLIEDVRSGRRKYWLHRTTIDDAIADGLFQRVCLRRGWTWTQAAQDEWRADLFSESYSPDEEFLCVPLRSGGTYLLRSLLERQQTVDADRVLRYEADDAFVHLSDEVRQRTMLDWLKARVGPCLDRLPKDKAHSLGEDFGRTSDLTVLTPLTQMQDLRRVTPFLVELRNVPYREQELALYYVADRLPRLQKMAFDATGNGGYLAERAMQRYGESCVEAVQLTEKWYHEHLPPLRAGFEDGMIEIIKDADVLADCMAFQVIDGIPKLPKARSTQKALPGTVVKRRHGDAGISLALAYYASRQDPLQYGYQSVGRREQRSKNGTRTLLPSGVRGRKGSIL